MYNIGDVVSVPKQSVDLAIIVGVFDDDNNHIEIYDILDRLGYLGRIYVEKDLICELDSTIIKNSEYIIDLCKNYIFDLDGTCNNKFSDMSFRYIIKNIFRYAAFEIEQCKNMESFLKKIRKYFVVEEREFRAFRVYKK